MTAKRARLTIDLEPEVHARLKIVAARRRTTMRQYTVQAIHRQLSEEPTEYLTAQEAPVLAELWNNPDDAAYDDL
jgi:predicted transcriptional regulator